MSTLGHVWQIQWSNPHTEPPEGMPRLLAEMYVPRVGDGSARLPAEIGGYPRPRGYTVYCMGLGPPLRPLPLERLVKLRRGRLERRLQAKAPLFAEEFIAERLARQPEYYAGTEVSPAREAILAVERRAFEMYTSRPGELIVYGKGLEEEGTR